MRKLLLPMAFILTCNSVAMAASLTGVQGTVLVDRGNGFVLAQTGADLRAGDRVMVQPSSSAQINFANGKSQILQPTGAIYTVPPDDQEAAAPVEAEAAGAGGFTQGAIIVGGIAAVAGGALLIAGGKSDKKSSSP